MRETAARSPARGVVVLVQLVVLTLALCQFDNSVLSSLRLNFNLQSEAKSDISSESRSPACVDIDGVLGDAARDCKEHEDNEEEEEGDTDEEDEDSKACDGGVPARVLERRLHELLQSRHEERIAELETELERAQRKLRDKEREVSRWRDTAKLVSRHKDESRLR